jgi:hypothetical protein
MRYQDRCLWSLDHHMTRAEHITWAKTLALDELDAGSPEAATASFTIDLTKHSETHALLTSRFFEDSINATLKGSEAVRAWIETIQ